jgi:pyruvate dehydrogenase E2 component (dihydrolipoamide acetyltransferase)
MPQMGYDMEQGIVVRWIKAEGDQVKRGEPLAEIETDKAVVEMESLAAGVLRKIMAEAGSTVPVGQVIAIVADPEEDIADVVAAAASAPAETHTAPQATPVTPAPAAPAPTEQRASAAEIKASPVARRLAQEKGLDLAQVTGTGPGGRITREDVETFETAGPSVALAASDPSVDGVERVELSRMRQAIARSTVQSKGQTPHFYITLEIDMEAAMDMRRQINVSSRANGGIHVSVNDIVVKAVTEALGKFPALNSFYQDGYIESRPYVNIGIAIALEEGLIVPAIANCESKSLVEISQASRDLVERAREGRLTAEEYAGGTFSISNMGMYDVDSFSAIILPFQSAVLAVASVRRVPVVGDNGQITVGQRMKVTISVDHRVSDGAEGARFLGELKRLLEHPVILLM